MPHKISEDTLYARALGIPKGRNGKRMIQRLGGAGKLKALNPEERNILLAYVGLRDDQPQKVETQ